MSRFLALGLLAAISVVFFGFAATTDTIEKALLFAVLGAVVPGLGLGAIALWRQWAWKRMGRELGLRPLEHGPYPDLAGKLDGRRLLVGRRADIYGPGRRETTVVRWHGSPEIRLPGLVVDAQTVRDILVPLEQAG